MERAECEEGYEEETEYYDEENTILKLTRTLRNGDPYSFDDKPAIIIYNKDGSIHSKFWFNGICIHRDNDLPAYVEYLNGIIVREDWFINGLLCRKNRAEPFTILYNANERKMDIKHSGIADKTWNYYENGVRVKSVIEEHTGQKVYIYYDGNFVTKYKFKNSKGKLDSNRIQYNVLETGYEPAYISFHKNAGVKKEKYYNDGKLHNNGSPAYIIYDKAGNVKKSKYYSNGVFVKNSI